MDTDVNKKLLERTNNSFRENEIVADKLIMRLRLSALLPRFASSFVGIYRKGLFRSGREMNRIWRDLSILAL